MARRAERVAGVDDVSLDGTRALVTGATSGIGQETALALGRLGADVLVHGRNPNRGQQVVARLRETGSDATFLPADFADLDAVRDLAAEIRSRVSALDVLVNNAGAHFGAGRLTDAGVERTMAVNHLAPFVLTNSLREIVPDGGRIVTVASAVHRRADPRALDPDRFTSVDDYDAFDAYARSKLANVLFTRELARRLEGAVTNCLHPGFIPASGLWREASLPVRLGVGALGALPGPVTRLFAETPATGAATPVYLAAAPEADRWNGEYFADCERRTPAPAARDDDLAERLWRDTEDLVG